MGKLNIISLLVVVVAQVLTGYLWFGPHLFGDVMTGHTVDFLRTDVLSVILLLLTAYGLTHVLDAHISNEGVKDVNGGIKLGLTVGSYFLGFPVIMLLNIFGGFSISALLATFGYLVILTTITTIVLIKVKKL
jgi:hypothetical protein